MWPELLWWDTVSARNRSRQGDLNLHQKIFLQNIPLTVAQAICAFTTYLNLEVVSGLDRQFKGVIRLFLGFCSTPSVMTFWLHELFAFMIVTAYRPDDSWSPRYHAHIQGMEIEEVVVSASYSFTSVCFVGHLTVLQTSSANFHNSLFNQNSFTCTSSCKGCHKCEHLAEVNEIP